MKYFAGQYDVIVIGAGHAGIEAALASARLGASTAVFTINLDWVGNMPCNPSIGGTSKGHLVREIDALGGEMGKAADKYSLQSRMLNLGKGPAVHSLRAQIDRREYSAGMKHTLEMQEKLDIRQGEIVEIYKDENELWHAVTRLDAEFTAKAVIISTGTFLGGRVYIGDVSFESGPDGMFPSNALAESLRKLNIPLRRFKTGTPSRVNRRSVDLDSLEVQNGDERTVPFSFETKTPPENKVVCHVTYTNEKTKKIILDNLHRSPMYSGKIEGKGPRYCPSFEDKIVRFADKERHQLFIEPCGLNTEELYLQGLSSSLPEDVQLDFIHTIPGLENAKVMRVVLDECLRLKERGNVFLAGQITGVEGYMESTAMGLVAGINAARKIQGKSEIVLDRGGSYIGTLIDDLVTKGCTDPYRMMTSRSEYRLVLRQDNADARLTPLGHEIGLISEERHTAFLEKQRLIEEELKRVTNLSLPLTDELQEILVSKGTAPLKTGCKMLELLRRPQITYADLTPVDAERPDLPEEIFEQVEISVKYEGYIKKQEAQIKEMRRIEQKLIPEDIDYSSLKGLRLEAVEKLSKIRPQNLGQASRISGVNPADITALNIILDSKSRS